MWGRELQEVLALKQVYAISLIVSVGIFWSPDPSTYIYAILSSLVCGRELQKVRIDPLQRVYAILLSLVWGRELQEVLGYAIKQVYAIIINSFRRYLLIP